MSNVTTYINESLEDLRLVRWPTRQQAVRFSGIVIGFTVICAAFFGLVDFIFSVTLKEILTLAA
jgi:preprotein translocase SecE subunit